MQFKDFEYDGISLSSMGLSIVSFDGVQDGDVTTDSQRTFNSISLFEGKYQPFVSSVYEDRLEVEFSIAKNLCGDESTHVFTISEIENIQYWLNRPTSHKFKILGDEEYEDIYWEGSFNLQWVKNGEDTIGFNATFTSNRPFAINEKKTYTKSLTTSDELIIVDTSYEEGDIVPDVEITLNESGDLELTNTFNGVSTVTIIKNCVADEVISISGLMQIASSIPSHNIYNDFNWIFPRIYNIYGDTTNTFTSNLSCDCSISYNPVRKVTFS